VAGLHPLSLPNSVPSLIPYIIAKYHVCIFRKLATLQEKDDIQLLVGLKSD
jgi:hypothetical protein